MNKYFKVIFPPPLNPQSSVEAPWLVLPIAMNDAWIWFHLCGEKVLKIVKEVVNKRFDSTLGKPKLFDVISKSNTSHIHWIRAILTLFMDTKHYSKSTQQILSKTNIRFSTDPTKLALIFLHKLCFSKIEIASATSSFIFSMAMSVISFVYF